MEPLPCRVAHQCAWVVGQRRPVPGLCSSCGGSGTAPSLPVSWLDWDLCVWLRSENWGSPSPWGFGGPGQGLPVPRAGRLLLGVVQAFPAHTGSLSFHDESSPLQTLQGCARVLPAWPPQLVLRDRLCGAPCGCAMQMEGLPGDRGCLHCGQGHGQERHSPGSDTDFLPGVICTVPGPWAGRGGATWIC